jgi:sporulation protein YlmC with PRC-barrel domain
LSGDKKEPGVTALRSIEEDQMKRSFTFLILTGVYLTLSACVTTATATTTKGPETIEAFTVTQLQDYSVKSPDGELLGKVADVVVATEDRQISYLILAIDDTLPGKGAFLGRRVKLIPIPWEVLLPSFENNILTVEVDPARLNNAPHFDRWPNALKPQWDREIRQYWKNN